MILAISFSGYDLCSRPPFASFVFWPILLCLTAVIVTLGFPDALEHWTNEQVMNFIHLMWNKTKQAEGEQSNGELNSNNGSNDTTESNNNADSANKTMEEETDPLHFLPGGAASPASSSPAPDGKSPSSRGPLDATIVVEVARKAFASLVANGVDVFSRQPGHPSAALTPAVLAPRDAIMVESVDGLSLVESMAEAALGTASDGNNLDTSSPFCKSSGDTGTASNQAQPTATTNAPISSVDKSSQQARSFVAPPQERLAAQESQLPDPSRKKRIVEWLCSNIKHLNKLSQVPFDSGELLKLHQHYFTPVVNESGGSTGFPNGSHTHSSIMSVPNVSRGSSNVHHLDESTATLASSTEGFLSSENMAMSSDPLFPGGQNSSQHPQLSQQTRYHQSQNSQPVAKQARRHSHQPAQAVVASSLPMLKRKVSYRFLGDAAIPGPSFFQPQQQQKSSSPQRSRGIGGFGALPPLGSVSKMIEEGPTGHSLPPKSKKARRNRTRISFLPRVKAKLDSYLDVCHEKALITMRQLYYVEEAILSGRVNPLDSSCPRTHLSGALATDAETIVVDMI